MHNKFGVVKLNRGGVECITMYQSVKPIISEVLSVLNPYKMLAHHPLVDLHSRIVALVIQYSFSTELYV